LFLFRFLRLSLCKIGYTTPTLPYAHIKCEKYCVDREGGVQRLLVHPRPRSNSRYCMRDTVRAKGSLIDFREHYIYTVFRGSAVIYIYMYRERGSLRASCGRRERYFPRSIRGIRGRRAGGLRSSSYIYNNVYVYSIRGSSKIRARSEVWPDTVRGGKGSGKPLCVYL